MNTLPTQPKFPSWAATASPIRQWIGAIALGVSCWAIAPASAQTIASSTTIGVATPACPEQTQLALNRCAARWARTADFLRSLVYEDLYWQLPESGQAQLVTIEQAWASYREIQCLQSSERYRGGSIYSLIHQSCLATMNNDRIADLQGLGPLLLTSNEAAVRLQQLLQELNLSENRVQRQWERYQTLHCQFEAQQPENYPGATESTGYCEQRLLAARIRQLEEMGGDR